MFYAATDTNVLVSTPLKPGSVPAFFPDFLLRPQLHEPRRVYCKSRVALRMMMLPTIRSCPFSPIPALESAGIGRGGQERIAGSIHGFVPALRNRAGTICPRHSAAADSASESSADSRSNCPAARSAFSRSRANVLADDHRAARVERREQVDEHHDEHIDQRHARHGRLASEADHERADRSRRKQKKLLAQRRHGHFTQISIREKLFVARSTARGAHPVRALSRPFRRVFYRI